MPAVVPFIPLIIGGLSAGVSAYQAFNQPSAPKPQPAPDLTKSAETTQKEAFLSAAPSVQERLGGAVAPEFFASEVARVSGNPADTDKAMQVLSQFLGLGGTPEKQNLTQSFSTGANQTFNPFTVGGGEGRQQMPNFFEGLLGGGSGGDGVNDFSGGFA